jgi:hypothetical protein
VRQRKRSGDVKYMMLIYHNAESPLGEDDLQGMMREVDGIISELTESGEWVTGEGLADPASTRVVRVRDGVQAVTDGPYLEAKEYLAGWCIVDCEGPERATEIAGRWPDARYTGVEVRPIMTP